MNQTISPTIKRTKQRIRQAFAGLLEDKKSLNNITITELVKRADVSRSAFYTHYKNLHDVVVDFQTEIFENFFSYATFGQIPTIDEYFTKLTEFLHRNEAIYRQLLASPEGLEYGFLLNKAICRQCYQIFREANDAHGRSAEELKTSINFFVDGFTGLLIKYYRQEIDLSLEQIVHYSLGIAETLLPQVVSPGNSAAEDLFGS